MSCSRIGFIASDSCFLDSFGRAAGPPAFKYQDLLQRPTIAREIPTGPISVVSGVIERVLGTCYPQEGVIAYHLSYLSANDPPPSPGKMPQSWQ